MIDTSILLNLTPLPLATDLPNGAEAPVADESLQLATSACLSTSFYSEHSSGPDGLGGAGNGRPKSREPIPIHLLRFYFSPADNQSVRTALFDRVLLETVHRRLGKVITDGVLVVGSRLVSHRTLRNTLSGLERFATADERMTEMVHLSGANILDGAFHHRQQQGFPLLRISTPSFFFDSGIREYRFFQKEGGVIIVDFSRAMNEASSAPALDAGIEAVIRQMVRLDVTKLGTLMGALYNEVATKKLSLTDLNYLQGFLISLETRAGLGRTRRGSFEDFELARQLKPEIFDQLWRFIYQVRMGGIPPLVQRSYRAVESALQSMGVSP